MPLKTRTTASGTTTEKPTEEQTGVTNPPAIRNGTATLADLRVDDTPDRPSPVIYALDLDEEVLAHLPRRESWDVFQAEGLSGDLIEDDEVRAAFDWQLRHLRDHHQLASAAVLADEFDFDFREPDTAPGDLLDRLRERYVKNHVRRSLRTIVEDVYPSNPLEVPQALVRLGRDATHLLVPRGEMYGTGDFDRTLRHYEQKAAAGPGPSFGHPELDGFFNGLQGVTFWLAPPKSYKSWMMVQCAAVNVLNGKSVCLIPLELPAVETNMRLYCMLANVPWWKYVHNKLSDQDKEELREASAFADGCGVYNIWKPEHGQRDITEMVHRARDKGADLVIIDQLQYIEASNGLPLGELNKTGEYFGVLDKARSLSDEGPLLIAHQFHRNPGGYESMPSVDHAKGSSSIEEVATLCLGMYQNKDMKKSHQLELGTIIARNAEWASWAVDINLTGGCDFTISHRIEDE